VSSPCLPTAQAFFPETALTLLREVAYVGVRRGFGLTRDDVQDPPVMAIRTQAVAMRPVRPLRVRDFLLGPEDKGAPWGGGSLRVTQHPHQYRPGRASHVRTTPE
jgi:hypothetical protein